MPYIQHISITLILQFFIFVFTGNPLASLAPFLIFVGREQSQAEYRYMDERKLNRSEVKFLSIKSLKSWDMKSILDWLLPMISSIILYIFIYSL